MTYALDAFPGAIIVVSHDFELLRTMNKLWHIDNGKISVFSGNYDNYMHEIHKKREIIKNKIAILDRQHKVMHTKLMKEQERAKKSKAWGMQRKNEARIVLGVMKERAQNTTSRNKAAIRQEREDLVNQLDSLRLPEVILPKFAIRAKEKQSSGIVQISNGSVGYRPSQPLLTNINITIHHGDRVVGPMEAANQR